MSTLFQYHQKSYSFGSNNVICTSTTATSYNSFQPRNKKLSSRPRTPRKSSSTSNSTSITTEQDSIASAQQPPSVNERYKLFLDEWDKGFMMNYKEQPDGYFADVIYGSIPMDIQGTYVRNGPGNFTIGKESRPIPHPYDGDGLIVSLSIKDGKAFFRSRYVQTHEYVSESNAQQIQFRGTFATQRAGGPLANIMDLYVKNTSNTNVVCFADRLMTFFEAGLPHALDPATLATIGVETLDGCLSLGLPFDLGSTTSNATMGEIMKLAHRIGLYYSSSSSPSHSSPLRIDTPTSSSQLLPDEYVVAGGDAFTAHPHIDPLTGHLHAFKYRMKPSFASSHSSTSSSSSFMNTELVFMEIDHDCKVTASQEFCISGFAFLHDFVLTKDYYIIFQNPVFVDNTPYILGQAPAASCVRWAPDTPTKVHLIPRNAKQQVGSSTKSRGGYRVFDIPPFFVFHHANAYQHGDDQVIIDSIYYDSLPAVGREALTSQQVDPDASFTSRLKRLHLNISTGVVKMTNVFDRYLEMPAINTNYFGRQHRYVYAYHSIFEDPQIALAKIDMDTEQIHIWRPGKNQFALEPKFIPRAGNTKEEEDGYLIAQLFNSKENRSEIVILDARKLDNDPVVARIALKEPIPHCLHGFWCDVYYGKESHI